MREDPLIPKVDNAETDRSTVFKQKTPIGKGILLLLGIFLFGILLLFFTHKHDNKTRSISNHQPQQTSSASRIFQQNQARLSHQHTQIVPPTIFHPKQLTTHTNNALKARLNAPTEVFGISSSATKPQQHVHQTLSGKGIFDHYANTQPTVVATVSAQHITHPLQTIVQGEFIHAVLETAINSELPGMVRAVTSEPVYAYRGNQPLIPAGSRLVGQYSSASSNGQASNRIFIMWNRMITPQGISVMINSPSADALGRSGLGANAKNSHFFQRFGTAALISLIGAGAANIGVNNSDQYNSAASYRESIANAFNNTASQVLSQQQQIQPTLHIHQGTNIVVFVAKDLDLYTALQVERP